MENVLVSPAQVNYTMHCTDVQPQLYLARFVQQDRTSDLKLV